VGGTEPDWNYARALDAIAHRGPDASALVTEGPVRVGFRRLSVIDLDEHANQPMYSPDRRVWLVFNGEIYGFRTLRRTLEQRGHAFGTDSDTEVLLHAYLEWGHDFVEHIDGMFAIALWDARVQKLTLYRDRAGIKPLYYFFDGKRFAFASELKAIEQACGTDALHVDPTALYDFLGYRYVPAPKTLYRECRKLPPAHCIEFDAATRSLGRPRAYWRLEVQAEPAPVDPADARSELRALIERSVSEQMVADVPLGFFLSGGVDSSVVVATAARLGARVSTFTIGFDSDEASETPYARRVAELFGTDHHERILTQDSAQALLPRLKSWFDEPFADVSAMPTYLVSQAAREHVTVVLTGDGGDEVFGGYRTYPRFERYSRYPHWPPTLARLATRLRLQCPERSARARALKLLEMAFATGPELWARIMAGMPEGEKIAYRDEFEIPADYDDWWHFREHWRPELPVRTRLQVVDFHTFMPGLVLTKVDRTSMAVSLEARVPLLDRRIIEFSFHLPESVRLPHGRPKGLLCAAFEGILPDEILYRRKKGFGIPRYYLRDVSDGLPIQEHVLKRLFLPTLRRPGTAD
jgi:asparagine synthase (glutamine-hydrolysing)